MEKTYEENYYVSTILAVPRYTTDESEEITVLVISFISSSEEEAEDIIQQHIGTLFSPVRWKIQYDCIETSIDHLADTVTTYEKHVRVFALGLVLMIPEGTQTKYCIASFLICSYTEDAAKKVALTYANEHFPHFSDYVIKMTELSIKTRFRTSRSYIH